MRFSLFVLAGTTLPTREYTWTSILWCEHAASNPIQQHSTQHSRLPGRRISLSPRRLLRERIELLLSSIKLGQELGHLRTVQLQGHDLILVIMALELQTHNSAGLR